VSIGDSLASRDKTYIPSRQPDVDEIDKAPSLPDTRHTSANTEHGFLIQFNINSSELSPEAFETLENIIEIALHHPESEILVRGYTDSRGDPELNEQLSHYRAGIVKSYLVEKGIANSRIKAIGLGSQKPIADNMTPEGRNRNRRVEINFKQNTKSM
jgi:outer membrane protein OmpA-like peptidoglycan-associated protein